MTQFQYDGLDIVREIGGVGDASYLRTLAIDEALTRTDAVETVYFLADALGSTAALTNPTGASTTTYTYEPHGRTAVEGTAVNPHQYTGRENDGTGLYYYRARYYAHVRQVFAAEDPVGLAGGDFNAYRFVMNNPILMRDPMGLEKRKSSYPMPLPLQNPYDDFNDRQRADFDRFVERVQEGMQKTVEVIKEDATGLIKWAAQMVEITEGRIPGAPVPIIEESGFKKAWEKLRKDLGITPRDADAADLPLEKEGPPQKGSFGRGR
jgi:RHS repeat-associated protein